MVLQEVKATEDTALRAFLPKQSSLGFPALPQVADLTRPAPLTSPGSPGPPALCGDRRDLSVFPTCPRRALGPGPFASRCHLPASTRAATLAWNTVPTSEPRAWPWGGGAQGPQSRPRLRSGCCTGVSGSLPGTGQTAQGLQPSGVCPQGPLPCGHARPEGEGLLEGYWGRERAEVATGPGWGDPDSRWGRAGGRAAIGLRRRGRSSSR